MNGSISSISTVLSTRLSQGRCGGLAWRGKILSARGKIFNFVCTREATSRHNFAVLPSHSGPKSINTKLLISWRDLAF